MSDKVKKTADVNDNETKKRCFIITPIGSDTDPIRRHVDGIFDAAIAPVLNEYGYEPLLPHRLALPGSINKQIIQMIHDSDLVIANLTNKNPNVMYELALRHCFGTPAIMIAEKGTELPFDINNQRTIFYVNDAQGVLDLKSNLKKAISELMENNSYESPIFSVLGDMKIEEQILQKAKEKSTDNNTDMLKLILNRLNRIENNVRTKNTDDSIIKYSDNKSTTFSFVRAVVSSNSAGEADLKLFAIELDNIGKEKNLAVGINDATDGQLNILILAKGYAKQVEAIKLLEALSVKYNLSLSFESKNT